MKRDLGMFKKSTSTSHEPPNTAEHLWLPAEQQQKIAERRGHQQNLVSGDSLLRLRHLGAHLHGLALRGARILVLEASLVSSLVTRLAVTSLLAGLGLHVEDDLPIPAMPSKRKHPYPRLLGSGSRLAFLATAQIHRHSWTARRCSPLQTPSAALGQAPYGSYAKSCNSACAVPTFSKTSTTCRQS